MISSVEALAKKKHIAAFLNNARSRARRKGVPFDITKEQLVSIATDKCPVFGVDFDWGLSGMGHGRSSGDNAPSLDRVIPELGYIKENLVFISHLANKVKQDTTEKELYAVADWLHDKRKEVLNALKERLTPLPEPPSTPGRKNPSHGAVHGAGPGKDCDGSQHYQGELFGEDSGHSPQEGC